jgi:hypothetical protein
MAKRLIQALLVVVALIAIGGKASAQTATATFTPTATATATATFTPTATATPTPVPANGGRLTCVTVTTAQTQVLAANDLGSGGRKQLCLINVSNTGANYVACNVANTSAVTISTGIILPAQGGASNVFLDPLVGDWGGFCFPPAQYSSPSPAGAGTVPSGQVNCIAAAAAAVVCALDY